MSDNKTIGVIFDVDGVLVDSYAAHLKSWRRLAAELGHTLTEGRFAATFGRTSRDIIVELFDERDDSRIRRLDDRKEALYRDLVGGKVPVMAGARELVAACRAAGFRLAVGSSGPPENVRLVCDEMGLTPLLSATVTGMDVTRGKPDPQVFLIAAERMELGSARCVVVEDAPSGIEAARAGGMASIGLVGTHAAEALSRADRVVGRLDEVTPSLIRALVG